MQVTKEQLTRISDAWGELAFMALELLERTAPEVEQASKNGAPIPDRILAARKCAATDLQAAMYAAPALAKAIGAVSSRAD
jgi:hypothetical protein